MNSDPEDPVLRGDFPVMVDAADSPARVATLLDNLRWERGVFGRALKVGADGRRCFGRVGGLWVGWGVF